MDRSESEEERQTVTQSSSCVNRAKFSVVANSKEEEDAFNIETQRHVPKPSGVTSSIVQMVKAGLGAGLLSSHVAYMKGGIAIAAISTAILGLYMTYCFYILVENAHILYKRTNIPHMTYPEVGEAALACFPNPTVAKWSKTFRYTMDVIICISLFGSCVTYQLIIAKTIKQLVEDTQTSSIQAQIDGYPDIRVYLAIIILPCICICLLRYLRWLAPFSLIGDIFIVLCIILTIYYAFENNPKFENLVLVKGFDGFFEFTGMMVFSMSCAGAVMPIENNMKEPHKFPLVLFTAMSVIVSASFLLAFFGYVAYLEKCDAPITVNFPMTPYPKLLKACIAVMIYVTHALNFWVPFNLCFYYIEKKIENKKHVVKGELIFRAIFVIIISLVAITFPDINALMGFLGCFCLSNMAFIWPNVIELLVIWDRPGLGKFRWRLWKGLILITIGIAFFVCGTMISGKDLLKIFRK